MQQIRFILKINSVTEVTLTKRSSYEKWKAIYPGAVIIYAHYFC